jgi:hypothetical protein
LTKFVNIKVEIKKEKKKRINLSKNKIKESLLDIHSFVILHLHLNNNKSMFFHITQLIKNLSKKKTNLKITIKNKIM